MTRNPELPLQQHFSAAGSRWGIRSNCAAVLQSAAETFPALSRRGSADLRVDIYVDSEAVSQALWSVPQFRGRDHLVFADFGPNNCLLADLHARHVIGRVGLATAEDARYWKRVIFPILLGVTAPVVNITPLHCACLQYKRGALLITGESGAGKSTLAFELARRGLEFISDDWTYFSRQDRQVLAWGLPTSIKLLPDSVSHFPELRSHAAVTHLNGELAFEIEPEEVGARRAFCCSPARIFLLDRQPGPGFEAARLSPDEIAEYFVQSLEKLPACLAQFRDAQLATIRALSRAESWYLRCGGSPQEIATRILRICEQQPSVPDRSAAPHVTRREWPDLLRRFVVLPFRQCFSFAGRSFQVVTDSEPVLAALQGIAEPAPAPTPCSFCWTIQEENSWGGSVGTPNGLAVDGLFFLNVGQHSFNAFDRNSARALAFIATAITGRELKSTLQTMLLCMIREATTTPLPLSPGPGSTIDQKLGDFLRHADA